MAESKNPTYTLLCAVTDGPLVRIGALWATSKPTAFTGKLDCVPMHPRIMVLPVDTDNPPPTVAKPLGKAPVFKLFTSAATKAPLIAIGALWHTADARGYQGVLDVAPLNGRILMFEHQSAPSETDTVPDIDWNEPTPF